MSSSCSGLARDGAGSYRETEKPARSAARDHDWSENRPLGLSNVADVGKTMSSARSLA